MNNVTAPPCDRMDFLDFSPSSNLRRLNNEQFCGLRRTTLFREKKMNYQVTASITSTPTVAYTRDIARRTRDKAKLSQQ